MSDHPPIEPSELDSFGESEEDGVMLTPSEWQRVRETVMALATTQKRIEELEAALEAIEKVGCMQREGDEEFWCRKDDSSHSTYCPRGIARAALGKVKP